MKNNYTNYSKNKALRKDQNQGITSKGPEKSRKNDESLMKPANAHFGKKKGRTRSCTEMLASDLPRFEQPR